MSAITELAGRLGKTIAESPQASALRAAKKGLDERDDVKKLLEEFRQQSEKVVKLQAENKTIEVDDKHKLQELQDKLIAEEVFKNYTAAQVEYVDLMRQVNTEITRHLGETERQ